jgi:hypothetical protein
MSPHVQYEIVRAHQQEIASRMAEARHARELQDPAVRTRRSVKSRVGHAIAALSVSFAIGR